MTAYLFITARDNRPESIRPGSRSKENYWSCSKTCEPGDAVFVYITGVGIALEWEVASKPWADPDWAYSCGVKFIGRIEPPISIQELRRTFTADEWKPPHLNFRGFRSIKIPDHVADRIRSLRGHPSQVAETESFERAIAKSLKDSAELRRQRLRSAKSIPERSQVMTSVFNRNPDVVAEVLLRAAGTCESCGRPAPFKRASDGTPYLEIHHKIRLADNGADTVENAIALCPNCHRQAHFG